MESSCKGKHSGENGIACSHVPLEAIGLGHAQSHGEGRSHRDLQYCTKHGMSSVWGCVCMGCVHVCVYMCVWGCSMGEGRIRYSWISGGDVKSFCCCGLVYLLDSW
jgi:hypothetical protein